MNYKLFTKSINKEEYQNEKLWSPKIINFKLFTKSIKKEKYKTRIIKSQDYEQ